LTSKQGLIETGETGPAGAGSVESNQPRFVATLSETYMMKSKSVLTIPMTHTASTQYEKMHYVNPAPKKEIPRRRRSVLENRSSMVLWSAYSISLGGANGYESYPMRMGTKAQQEKHLPML
jgi:hypothetical protein